jgi:hypothetical protein
VFGDDHPDTLAAARGFAADLRALGHIEAALRLDEDTLARSRDLAATPSPWMISRCGGVVRR